MEYWKDADFARNWAEQNVDHPSRRRTLDLLVKIAADYLNASPVPRHILDVGCGHGVIAARLLSEIPDTTLVGVDGSPPMLDMARERLAPPSHDSHLYSCRSRPRRRPSSTEPRVYAAGLDDRT